MSIFKGIISKDEVKRPKGRIYEKPSYKMVLNDFFFKNGTQ